MTRGKWIALGLAVIMCGMGTMAYLWATGTFDQSTPEPIFTYSKEQPDTGMVEALRLIRDAKAKFADVKDYSCTYLRDEVIDGKTQSNHTLLQIRHEPFSVGMEWVGPSSKKGRRMVWTKGKNGGKMTVKVLLKLDLDPQESVKRKESRHTIDEAGLKNLIDRYHTSWEKEQQLGLTQIIVQNAQFTIKLPDRDHHLDCICVTSVHPPDSQKTFKFHIAKLFFDKKTGLPVRSENYDFPAPGQQHGPLAERYTYLDMQTNLGLTDEHFTIR
jgi:hypothetical protein